MFKKFLTAIILIAFLIVGNNFCNAEMPRKEMYLGGMTFGTSTAQMLRMYGAPNKTEGGIEYLYTCYYGNGVKISYNAYANKIFEIIVSENNGWNTPCGLAVGMTIDKAFELYGNADFERYGADKSIFAYFHSNGNSRDFGFIILVDNATQKILRIEITGNNSMATFDDFFESLVNYEIGAPEEIENVEEVENEEELKEDVETEEEKILNVPDSEKEIQ